MSVTGVLLNPKGVLLTPSQLPPGKYYRFTRECELHNGVRYKTGLNVDPLPFNPTGECQPGGMYFLHESQLDWLYHYCQGTVWMREVTFPEDVNVSIWAERRKYKADRFILGERELIPEWVWLRVVKDNGMCLDSVPVSLRSKEVCKTAVDNCCYAIQCVPRDKMTPELLISAVRSSGYTLRYVPIELHTDELYEEAVLQDGESLEFVSEDKRSYDLCVKAVSQTGLAVKYVPIHLKCIEIYRLALEHGYPWHLVPYRYRY